MSKYRAELPLLADKLFITDGGLETTLVFHDGIELPCFAAFDLLKTKAGESRLREYFREYAAIARDRGVGMVLESPTWRANRDWGDRIGYGEAALRAINQQAIEMLEDVREEFETGNSPMVISACIGPRDDGYNPSAFMSAQQACDYHRQQVATFAETGADMVSAYTICYSDEAIGIVNAAREFGLPVVISFTVETDGLLPSGMSLQQAIETVDAATGGYPAYYMINCAHPTHFEHVLETGADWVQRIRGLRANASCKSHAELDESTELDDGNPAELGSQYHLFSRLHGHINVMGGCCGTDHRHIDAICEAVLAA